MIVRRVKTVGLWWKASRAEETIRGNVYGREEAGKKQDRFRGFRK